MNPDTGGFFLTDFVIPNTAIPPLTWPLRKWGMTMDAKHLREKATLCFRLADGLSLNNPSRFELLQTAEDFENRAKELEAQSAQQNRAVTDSTRLGTYCSNCNVTLTARDRLKPSKNPNSQEGTITT
jgi:hypothetical protein